MTSPRILLAAYNLHPKKQFGQNFLSDPSTAKMIATFSGITSEDVVLEIGAGLGALTIPAAKAAKKVYAIEKDRRLIDLLKTEILANMLSNVELMEENILKFDINRPAENVGRKIIVIGNLPYNISSQILVKLIKSRASVIRAVLMFQKELARRITAQPDCKDYGRLTVMLGYCAKIKKLADIKAHQFFPKPKVDSELLEIRFLETIKYPANDEALLFRVIKGAFSHRRKTLKNALAGSELHIDAKTAQNMLDKAGIDPSLRAETLTISQFVRLSNVISD
ncbi:MAG: ribosomal RNA small subunit methyltransferase A [Desulfobacterales bacterium]|uniref:Ribosomal RNA small subunit methyltransferase A n=1 Tax=Candidatus Desulfaltia bathyphila TaxID=2841697 RepID=A0A8J6N776_9BACT|nr:ribosomal RNA small subunit methyltransferase A [Candidatus Desulfaltia bathyphila]MBL7195889.1 ribosomal RNA small subunit methyltransferase A [Desulfobacterales bacterium]MBL7207279.1 ribosomal RNA small subunit methyltransferase A [Desulfobacterales bacterium]